MGYDFSEIIYKDAIEQEFIAGNIPFTREEELVVQYKGKKLKHFFRADFTLYDNIITEVKSGAAGILHEAIPQTLIYLRASGLKVGLIVNFGRSGLEYKRLVM